jgi:hypothetical protein
VSHFVASTELEAFGGRWPPVVCNRVREEVAMRTSRPIAICCERKSFFEASSRIAPLASALA